jgi:hypothetical protein
VILHIGTHKTGTSSLQECLRRNDGILAAKGIYYARLAPYKNANGLAKIAAKSRGDELKAFMDRHIDRAAVAGANTLIVSAESFYAMAMFFHKFNGRHDNYWAIEEDSVAFLCNSIPAHISKKVVVFFRRQDVFLESIYREVIKSRGVAMTIDEFRRFFMNALNYFRHMEIWRGFFSEHGVYTYEQASRNIPDFFLRNVLHITDTDNFEGLDLRMNVHLSRDLIEYKRILNNMEMSEVDRYLSNLICTEIARTLPDDRAYDDYLAPDTRETLLREMQSSNTLLSKEFGMEPFPSLDSSKKYRKPYPGLTPERLDELAARYAHIAKSASFRIGRSALVARQFIEQRLPKLSWIIPLGRHLSEWHRQLR